MESEDSEKERLERLYRTLHSLATRIPAIRLKRAEEEFPVLGSCMSVKLRFQDTQSAGGKYKAVCGLKTLLGVQHYVCVVCYQPIKNWATLQIHERVHTGVRPFECKHCKKKFNQSGNYNAHRRVCSQSVTHNTPQETSLTSNKVSVIKSTSEATTEKVQKSSETTETWPCPVCNKSFSLLSSLKKHYAQACGNKRKRKRKKLQSPAMSPAVMTRSTENSEDEAEYGKKYLCDGVSVSFKILDETSKDMYISEEGEQKKPATAIVSGMEDLSEKPNPVSVRVTDSKVENSRRTIKKISKTKPSKAAWCPNCNREFSNWGNVKRHLDTCSKEQKDVHSVSTGEKSTNEIAVTTDEEKGVGNLLYISDIINASVDLVLKNPDNVPGASSCEKDLIDGAEKINVDDFSTPTSGTSSCVKDLTDGAENFSTSASESSSCEKDLTNGAEKMNVDDFSTPASGASSCEKDLTDGTEKMNVENFSTPASGTSSCEKDLTDGAEKMNVDDFSTPASGASSCEKDLTDGAEKMNVENFSTPASEASSCEKDLTDGAEKMNVENFSTPASGASSCEKDLTDRAEKINVENFSTPASEASSCEKDLTDGAEKMNVENFSTPASGASSCEKDLTDGAEKMNVDDFSTPASGASSCEKDLTDGAEKMNVENFSTPASEASSCEKDLTDGAEKMNVENFSTPASEASSCEKDLTDGAEKMNIENFSTPASGASSCEKDLTDGAEKMNVEEFATLPSGASSCEKDLTDRAEKINVENFSTPASGTSCEKGLTDGAEKIDVEVLSTPVVCMDNTMESSTSVLSGEEKVRKFENEKKKLSEVRENNMNDISSEEKYKDTAHVGELDNECNVQKTKTNSNVDQSLTSQHMSNEEKNLNLTEKPALGNEQRLSECVTVNSENEPKNSECDNSQKDSECITSDSQNELKNSECITGNSENKEKNSEHVTSNSQNELKNSECITGNSEHEEKKSECITSNTQNELRNIECVTGNSEIAEKSSECISNNSQNNVKNSECVTDNSEKEDKNSACVTNNSQIDVKSSESVTINSEDQNTNNNKESSGMNNGFDECESAGDPTNDNMEEENTGGDVTYETRSVGGKSVYCCTKCNILYSTLHQVQVHSCSEKEPSKHPNSDTVFKTAVALGFHKGSYSKDVDVGDQKPVGNNKDEDNLQGELSFFSKKESSPRMSMEMQ